MLQALTELYYDAIAFLGAGDGFLISFVAGFLAVIFHAKRRLQISTPKAEEYDFIRLISLPTLVGEDLFRRSYIIYVSLLETFYIFLCLIKPLFPNIVGNMPDYQGAAWPLGAALVVVGLLPTFPWIDQVELWLRQFSLSAANIPEEFFRRVSRLSQSEIRKFLESEKRFQLELNRYFKVFNLALSTGCSPSEANEAARRAIGFALFSKWTVEDSTVWDEGERERFKEVFDLLKPKVQSLKTQLEFLIGETASCEVVRSIMAETNVTSLTSLSLAKMQEVTDVANRILNTRKLKDNDNPDEAHRLAYDERIANFVSRAGVWRDISRELGVSTRRLCAVFSTIAINDRSTTLRIANQKPTATSSDDTANNGDIFDNDNRLLREMLKVLNNVSNKSADPIYNAVGIATIAAFIACFLLMIPYRYAELTWLYGAPQDSDGRNGPFVFSLYTSITLTVTFASAGIAALFFRKSKKDDNNKWSAATDFLQFPVSQYCKMLLAVLPFAVIPYFLLTIADAYRTGAISAFVDLSRYGSISFILFCITWSLAPAAFAIALCLIADRADAEPAGGANFFANGALGIVVSLVVFVIIQAFISVDSRYQSILWNSVASIAVFSVTALPIFGLSRTRYNNRRPDPDIIESAAS